MPAPTNRQEFPQPAPNWRGAKEVDPSASRSLSKVARLWATAKSILETPCSTLCRVAHRVVDRTTGIPYSADELEAKILAQTGQGTTDSLTTSDGTSAAGAGELGEYIQQTKNIGAAVTLSGPTTALQITLSPGDWDVQAHLNLGLTAASVTEIISKLQTTPAGVIVSGSDAVRESYNTTTETGDRTQTHPSRRFLVSSETTVYLNVSGTISAGTVSAYGFLSARRVR